MKSYDSVRGRAEFQRIRSAKRVSHSEPMAIYQASGAEGAIRLGLVASAKLGSAVRRNRAKRRIRAAFAMEVNERFAGLDFVIHAKPAAIAVDFSVLRSAVRASVRSGPQAQAPRP